jgi:hypothetical protein
MPREEILGRYAQVSSAQEIVGTYLPLVRDLGADIVTFQMASLDQPALIRLLGNDVLPVLKGELSSPG